MKKIFKYVTQIFATLIGIIALFPTTALATNPMTGDNKGTVVWIIIGAVALADVIAAIILLVSNKNKK